jgi:biotin carboxyl carrier protein
MTMRRYTIAVNGRTWTLDVRELSADRFEVSCGERQLEVRLVDDADLPQASITPEMTAALRAPALAVAPRPPGQTQSGAAVAPAPAPVPRPPVPNTAAVARSRTLTAPMPGVIVAVEVKPGAQVRRGDVLVTLEAMKMVNSIRAPRDAVVSDIDVAPGQTVAFGDALMRFAE